MGPSLWLFGATFVGNVCNFLYHLYMIRQLSPEQYAMLTALIGLMAVVAVPATTVQTTTSHRVASLDARAAWWELRADLRRRFIVGGLSALLGFALIAVGHKALMVFLRFPEAPAVALSWGGAVALAFLLPVAWGSLQGLQAFRNLGASLVLNGGLKLVLSVLLVGAGGAIMGAMTGLLGAAVVTLGVAGIQIRRVLRDRHAPAEDGLRWDRAVAWIGDGLSECWVLLRSPWQVSGYPFIVAASVMAYTSLTTMDVVLVKHFFDPMTAGHYAVGAMVSRMVLFLPMAFSMVLFPKVTQATALGQDARPLLRRVMLATASLSGAACLACLGFPAGFMRVLAGTVYQEAIPIVRILAVAMAEMAVANLVLVYLLASQATWRTLPYLVVAVAHLILISLWRSRIQDVAWITLCMAGCLTVYAGAIVRGAALPRLRIPRAWNTA